MLLCSQRAFVMNKFRGGVSNVLQAATAVLILTVVHPSDMYTKIHGEYNPGCRDFNFVIFRDRLSKLYPQRY